MHIDFCLDVTLPTLGQCAPVLGLALIGLVVSVLVGTVLGSIATR